MTIGSVRAVFSKEDSELFSIKLIKETTGSIFIDPVPVFIVVFRVETREIMPRLFQENGT